MKKILIIIILSVGFMTVHAQWANNAAENKLISAAGEIGQSMPKTVKTSDNKVFVSWTANGLNFHTKLQLFDKDGNALWQEGGIYVSQYASSTFTTDYTLGITPDDCAILAFSDSRTEPDNKIFQPFIYKINKAGEFLWGINGVKLPFDGNGGYRPRFCVLNSGSVVAGWSNADNGCVSFMKITSEGEFAWGDCINIDGAAMVNMVPSGEEGFIITYYIQTGGDSVNFYAQKYNGNGEPVWDNPVIIDNSGGVSAYNEPHVKTDGDNGLVTIYGKAISNNEIYVMLQRVDKDGELAMGLNGVKVSNLPCIHTAGQFDIDTENGEIFVQEISYGAGSNEGRRLIINKFDIWGETYWDEAGIVLNDYLFEGYMNCAVQAVGDGSAMSVYIKDITYTTGKIMAAKIESDGAIRWKDIPICNVDAKKSRIVSTPVFNNQICIFWSDTRNVEKEDLSGYGQIFGQNISLDGKLGVLPNGISNLINNDEQVSIYPNPTIDKINIDCKNISENKKSTISIVDLSGRTVEILYDGIISGTLNFNVNNLNSGLYFVKIDDGKNPIIRKLVISEK